MSTQTPTVAQPRTAAEAAPNAPLASSAPTTHLDWAARIKEQHRHLQAAVVTHRTPAEQRDTHTRHACPPVPAYEAELAVWRGALCGEEAAARLTAYATAMHHLATQYWDPDTAPAERDAHMHGSVADPATAEPRGVKRQRGDARATDVTADATNVVTGAACTTDAATSGSDNPRHYSDRLAYCLQSTAAYFLGELAPAASPAAGSGTPAVAAGGAAPPRPSSIHATASTVSAASPAPAAQPFIVELHGTRFLQLPGVFARAVKPLRRLFFQRHQRMATEAEVAQLIAACTPPATSAASVDGGAPVQERSDAAVVAELLTKDSAAVGVVAESAWRRDGSSAWATAQTYISETSPVPPLWVLDVGSCYGPFARRQLSRGPSRPPVPLHVTSMDLAPYEEAEHSGLAPGSSSSAAAPRVWQADWLQMEFFPAAGGAGTAPTPGNAVVGEAEDGRVRYRAAAGAVPPDGAASPSAAVASSCDERGRRRGPATAVAVRLESFDAIYFCLLLSYMPTPRLRFLACVHAFLALREGGLLVVVSTRTQGPRRRNWMDEWAACLASIGFQRVQQSIQEKIVGMSFAKVTPSAAVREGWATAEGRAAWVRQQMESTAAATGLRIIADDAKDRGDI